MSQDSFVRCQQAVLWFISSHLIILFCFQNIVQFPILKQPLLSVKMEEQGPDFEFLNFEFWISGRLCLKGELRQNSVDSLSWGGRGEAWKHYDSWSCGAEWQKSENCTGEEYRKSTESPTEFCRTRDQCEETTQGWRQNHLKVESNAQFSHCLSLNPVSANCSLVFTNNPTPSIRPT